MANAQMKRRRFFFFLTRTAFVLPPVAEWVNDKEHEMEYWSRGVVGKAKEWLKWELRYMVKKLQCYTERNEWTGGAK